MQLVDGAVDDKGVARVMAALKPADDVSAFAEPVHDLAFPLVAPLGAYDDYVGHDVSSVGKPAPV